MQTTLVGIVADDPLRSQAPKAQPLTYVQGTTHRVDLKVVNEDGSPYDLTSSTPKLATTLLDGTAHQETFSVDDAPNGTAHVILSPGSVLTPGAYVFQCYLEQGEGDHNPIIADSALTVKASSIPTS